MNKVEYTYFTRPHKRKIHPIPPVILPASTIPRGTRTSEPQPHIGWLGLIFDSILSLRQHIEHLASRGATEARFLRMLANTTGGLGHQIMKLLLQGLRSSSAPPPPPSSACSNSPACNYGSSPSPPAQTYGHKAFLPTGKCVTVLCPSLCGRLVGELGSYSAMRGFPSSAEVQIGVRR